MTLSSQTFCISIDNPQIIASGTKLQFDINMNAVGSGFKIGTSNLVFNFNTNALSNPVLTNNTFPNTFRPVSLTNPAVGRASLNTELLIDDNGKNIATSPTLLATATLDITPGQSLGSLNWSYTGDQAETAVFLDGSVVTQIFANSPGSGCIQSLINTPLPLDLVSFDAKPVKNDVKLTWITRNEVDFERFEIEKSSDAISFEKIGTVYPNQTRSTSREYTFLDDKIALGMQNYYRLKMIDNDQSFKYSKIVSEYFDNTYDVQVYPNPTKDFIYIKVMASDNTEPLRFTLYDIKNSLIITSNLLHSETQIDISKVPVGEYFYRIEGKNYKNEGKLLFGR